MTGMKLDFPYLIADRDRHGNVRFYVREPGRPKVRIRETPGTPEFNRAYESARAAPAPQRRPSETPHTLRWIARLYMSSADFRRLDPASQRNRAAVLHSCLEEPLKPKGADLMGDCPVAVFGPAHIRVLRDRKGDEPGAANNRLKYLSSMFGWAVEAGLEHCSAHGLRKAGASMAAENGATEEQLRAIFNWSTAKQSATYTRRARRRVLTANLGELIKLGEN